MINEYYGLTEQSEWNLLTIERKTSYSINDVENNLDQLKLEIMNIANDHDSPLNTAWFNNSHEENRAIAIDTVETVIFDQMKALMTEESDALEEDASGFTYPAYKDWRNIEYIPSIGLVPKNSENIKLTSIPVDSVKYGRLMLTLQNIHSLLVSNTYATKRELFYRYINDYLNQANLDESVTIISVMLQIPRQNLHIMATSKGLIAGNLSYLNEDGVEVDCRLASGGEIVPSNINCLTNFRTDAKIILVVEKDAVFQTLLQDQKLQSLKTIFITGKGVPDLNTRQLVCKLSKCTKIPIFALVDADPYGIEIMCVYRFGSLTTTWCAESLAVSTMNWLGLHPSDFPDLNQSQMKSFSRYDQMKCNAILDRPYIEYWPGIKEQLEIISAWQQKAEIENLTSPSDYIIEKIQEKAWI